MTDLTDIIARLEKCVGPDRELDALIACVVRHTGLRPARPDDFDGKYGYRAGDLKTETGFLQAWHYTSSIEDALTLKPDDWEFVLWTENGLVEAYPTKGVERPTGIKFRVQGHDLALAICIAVAKIAALKARPA